MNFNQIDLLFYIFFIEMFEYDFNYVYNNNLIH